MSLIGSFAPGKSFDALIVGVRPEMGNPSIWSLPEEFLNIGSDSKSRHHSGSGEEAKTRLDGLLERFLFGGDDRNILKVFVQGRCIGGTAVKDTLRN